MTTLHILFGNHTVEISRVPDSPINIVACARNGRRGWNSRIILKDDKGRLYCTNFRPEKGFACCHWDSDVGLGYLPALHRLKVLPKGYSIAAAQTSLKKKELERRHRRLVSELRDSCEALGIKMPRVPAFKLKA